MKRTGLKPSKRKRNELAKTSNQWVTNPRQDLFLEKYFDPMSRTFGNVYRSALEAGYSESYARNLTTKQKQGEWLLEYVDKTDLTPEHITAGIASIARTGIRQRDKLRAYELLAKLQGMLIDRSANVHFNIETALSQLK